MSESTDMTTRVAARYLNRDESLVRKYLLLGELRGRKAGRDWLIDRRSLRRLKTRLDRRRSRAKVAL